MSWVTINNEIKISRFDRHNGTSSFIFLNIRAVVFYRAQLGMTLKRESVREKARERRIVRLDLKIHCLARGSVEEIFVCGTKHLSRMARNVSEIVILFNQAYRFCRMVESLMITKTL